MDYLERWATNLFDHLVLLVAVGILTPNPYSVTVLSSLSAFIKHCYAYSKLCRHCWPTDRKNLLLIGYILRDGTVEKVGIIPRISFLVRAGDNKVLSVCQQMRCKYAAPCISRRINVYNLIMASYL